MNKNNGLIEELLMRRLFAFSLFIILCLPVQNIIAGETDKETPVLKSTSQKFSYVMGRDVITALKKLNTQIDFDAFILGAEDCFHGRPSQLTEEEITQVKKEVSHVVREKQKDQIKAAAEKNLRYGKAFLQENSKKPGIIVTRSGLQYEILKEGEGRFPNADDEVVVHYRGFLLDGKEFDSSYQRGGPTKVRVRDVLPGWSEALQKMRAGSKFKIYLPADLAYGPHYSGRGGVVGPNSTIIFEIDLLEILPVQKNK